MKWCFMYIYTYLLLIIGFSLCECAVLLSSWSFLCYSYSISTHFPISHLLAYIVATQSSWVVHNTKKQYDLWMILQHLFSMEWLVSGCPQHFWSVGDLSESFIYHYWYLLKSVSALTVTGGNSIIRYLLCSLVEYLWFNL